MVTKSLFLLVGLSLSLIPSGLKAQTDTLAVKPSAVSHDAFIDRLTDSPAFRMTYVGVPLIAGGLLVKGEDDHFRNLRNDYLPVFRRHATTTCSISLPPSCWA